MGRFMTPDRMTKKPSDPSSWNKYPHASGEAINGYDPPGTQRRIPIDYLQSTL
jgi:hypothetical protein